MKNAVFSLLAIAAAANAGKVVSTVFETEVKTITSCAPTVTDCPAKHETIVHTYTSECEEETSKAYPTPTQVYTSAATTKAYTVSTVYETKEYTITSCAPTVTNCPVGHATTTVNQYTTLCPVEETHVPYPPKETHVPYPYPPSKGNGTYPVPPPKVVYPPTENTPYAPPPPPAVSTVVYSTCIPTYITKVVTVTAAPVPSMPAGCPGGYNCPPASNEAPAPSYPAGGNAPAPSMPAGCPGGYNCPAETTAPYGTGAMPTGAYYTKPAEYTGSASTQRAGGLLLAVGLAALALF